MAGGKLVTIAYVLLIAGGVWFLWLLLRTVARFLGKQEEKSRIKSRFSGFVDFLLLFMGLTFMFGAQTLFWLSSNLKYHIPIAERNELGRIETFKGKSIHPKQGFRYTPIQSEGEGQTFSFELDGYKWHMIGEFIEWPKWASVLDLHSSGKITQICSAGFEEESDGLAGKDYYVIGGGETGITRAYDRFGVLFLGTKVRTLHSENVLFEIGHTYTVLADSSGLILEE